MDIFAWIVANGTTIFSIATSVVGCFALIASVTPNKTDDTYVAYLTQIIHFLGANFFKAASVPADTTTPPAA